MPDYTQFPEHCPGGVQPISINLTMDVDPDTPQESVEQHVAELSDAELGALVRNATWEAWQ